MEKLRLPKQRGAAIIVALFVVALVGATATLLLERLRMDIRRTQLILNANKAYLLAQGSIAWAKDQLTTNGQQFHPDTLIDRTPIKAPTDHIEGATITSVIKDAQGFFNINNLTDPIYQTNFTRLLRLISPTLDGSKAEEITLNTADWIYNGAKTPALDEYYLKQTPSYRSAHRLMVSVSELRLVKGVTADLYIKLSPNLIALPTTTPINVNNTTVPVLMSLSMALSEAAAKDLINKAANTPFKNAQEFLNSDIVKNNGIDANKITTVSNYFLLETNVTLDNQQLILYTLLQRTGQGKETKTVILWQSKGSL